ncbi:mannosyltransferase family protein [Streptomyces sp. SR27]|uniref:mannosyltransferase family protein n=1 Tax=Streptomyces sp. SR27 TaxID=3076630 RepID=UPI00295B1F09|nr:mannosyltransferase family protein [Streptomyces sp. SR27]MDV9187292.1 mannosyltransferase family protein [Streptomyces sp. SR27]
MTPMDPDIRNKVPTAPAAGHRPGPSRRPLRLGLDAGDRDVLALYLFTRVSLLLTAYCTAWLFPRDPESHDPGAFAEVVGRWDWNHFLHIARDGYFPDDPAARPEEWDNREAFFPGFPLLLRALHPLVGDWTAAGLLVSLVAGAVAVLALGRIARLHLPQVADAHRAVLLLLVSPCAVFLAIGYTESLFLAFALPAWLAALRHDWRLAGLLTACATTVRVSGLFLVAALLVHFALTARRRCELRRLPWLALPALPPLLYSWYLYGHTGSWMAWKHAQEQGWYREFHTPWDAWSTTWNAAFDHGYTAPYALMWQAELIAMCVGLVTVVLLARARRWPEAVYIALSLWSLGTSYWYMSIPRATVLWWPLWIGLACWTLRRPRLSTAWLCLSVPLSAVLAVTFFSGRWAG